jgi:hypothetical protein
MEELDENGWPIDNNPTSNPFTGTFDVNIIRTHIIERPNGYGITPEDHYFDVEQLSKTSIYKNMSVAILLCQKAKPVTSKLFLYILYELLKPNKDFILIDPKLTQSRLDISRASLYSAISELSDFKVITRKKGRNFYWINPEYIFNGNRIAYMEINAKERLIIKAQRTIRK